MPVSVSTATDATPGPTATLLNGERLYSFSTIAAKLPGYRANCHVNSSTVFRWATKGVRVGGTVIRLEAVRLGAAWKTSLEAVARFSAKLTAAATPPDGGPPAAPAPTPRQRSRAAAHASKQADAIFGPSNQS